MNRRVAVNLVAFVGVFVLMLWWAVNNIISFEFLERPYEISGEFAATAGVSDNSEVAYLGVHYGQVSEVELADDRVRIEMKIDRGKRIPAGSIARIFRKSAVGEPYIDFAPPEGFEGDDGPWIEEGAVIPMDRTTVPLEFSELLRAASRVLEAVDPAQARTLVHELAVALNGRGQTLRDLTVSSDALLQTFADRTELLDSLTDNSTRLTRTVAERRESLSSAVRDLTALADTLRRVEPATNVLLERGTELLDQTGDLVADVKGDLDCVLHDLDDVIDVTTTEHNLGNLRTTLERGPEGLNYVWLTRDDGPGGVWVRVHLVLELSEPAEQYLPPTELPAVPEIPPCTSPFNADSGDDDPAPAPADGGDEVAAARAERAPTLPASRSAATPAAEPVALGDTVPTAGEQALPGLIFLVVAAIGCNLVFRRWARP